MKKYFVSLLFILGTVAVFAQMPASKFNIGEKISDIKLPDADGKILKLKDIQNKVVLIDFWASWCRPCRAEMPFLKKAYAEYKTQTVKGGLKGFEIYSISTDKNPKAWKKALEEEQLPWKNNVLDGNTKESSMAYLYNIQYIPQNYLINAQGVIIAKNLRGEQLEKELMKLFKP